MAVSSINGMAVWRLTLLLLLWLTSSLTLASDARKQTLTCYSTVFEPFVISQNPTEIAGIDIEVIRAASQRAGFNVEFGLMPWLRLEQNLREGKGVDCAFSYSSTEPRQAYMQFTHEPLHTTEYVLFYRQADFPEYRDLTSLKGARIGVNRGFRRPAEFDQALQRGLFEVFEVTEDSQSFAMLEKHRLDAVLANADVGRYLMLKLGLSADIVSSAALSSMPTYLVFSRQPQYRPLLQRFDAALREMKTDGSYQAILAHYRLPPERD